MHTFCSICGLKLRDEKPYGDERNVPRICKDCEQIQDNFITEMVEKEKRIAQYLLDGGRKKPQN